VPEGAPLAHRLAEFQGALAVNLGIRDDGGAIVREVGDLIAEPVTLFQQHAAWPSLLTDSGIPVELSLRLTAAGEPSLRCVSDVTDHRVSLADNWSRYVDYARRVAADAAGVDEVWDLCRLHLDAVPTGFRSRMIHGLGYAKQDWRRGSLYFRTSWLPARALTSRLPAVATALAEVERSYGSPVSGEVEVMGYDFVPRQPVRAKAYSWTPPLGELPFETLVGRHPDLEPAREIFETFRAAVDPADSRALLLQTSTETSGAHQRLFFLGHAWRWDAPTRRDELLRVVAERLGIDVAPLAALEDTAAHHGIAVSLAMVAAGAEQDAPSVTFYLWPAPAAAGTPVRQEGRATLLRTADMLAARAVDYVLGARSDDGSWRDYGIDRLGDADSAAPPGLSDAFVTAYVASTLAADPALRHDLDKTFEWLAARYQGACVWGDDPNAEADAETTALAVVAGARFGSPLPAEVNVALVSASGDAPPDVAAAILLALAEAFPERISLVVPAAASVVARQRSDGAWTSTGWDDDLVATSRATRALQAYLLTDFARSPFGEQSRSAASRALGRSAAFLSSLTVAQEPFRLSLWLGTWASARTSLAEPHVARALAALGDLQRPDGRWLGAPNRRVSADDSFVTYTDGRCIVTTATAIAALQGMVTRLAA
jgi:hypothetical protein